MIAFQIYDPRAARDGGQTGFKLTPELVSIHARVRRATTPSAAGLAIHSRFQSTLACGERLPGAVKAGPACRVSIHARVRRATPFTMTPRFTASVSIHARVRRATFRRERNNHSDGFQSTLACGERRRGADGRCAICAFQSTLACGERLQYSTGKNIESQVSIHARVRRATCFSASLSRPQYSFNPRSRAASDRMISPAVALANTFQSTLACGERHFVAKGYAQGDLFQSTLACGERPEVIGTCACGCGVSIHARVRRATMTAQSKMTTPKCFNPRSRAASDRASGPAP